MNGLVSIWNKNRILRFVVVGGWNTLVAYGAFALLYYLFGGGWGDVVVQIVSAFIGITHAYVMHRFLTYRSNGVWWCEYLRFYVVYGSQTLLQACMFFVLSTWLGCNGYVTQLTLAGILTLATYWAHGHYSFRK